MIAARGASTLAGIALAVLALSCAESSALPPGARRRAGAAGGERRGRDEWRRRNGRRSRGGPRRCERRLGEARRDGG